MAKTDLISRRAAIDCEYQVKIINDIEYVMLSEVQMKMRKLPPAEPEPLTDKEQRIFLAAMGREMKICEEVDRNYVREPYEDSLVKVCREIERKVKGALWTYFG